MPDSNMALADIQAEFVPANSVRPSGSLQVVTVSRLEEFRPHLAAWDRLASEAPQMIPCLMPAWVDAYLRYRLNPRERWQCSFAYSGSQLVGVLPVVISPHRLLGHRWPLLRIPADELTPSGDVLLAPDHAAAAFRALLIELRRVLPTHLGLSMRSVRKKSPLWRVLEGRIEGYVSCSGACSRFSFLNVQESFDSYFASLGHMRRNLKRFRKKLESQGPVSLELRRGSPDAEAFLKEFVALEAVGWKGRNGTAMQGNPSGVAFYSALAKNLAKGERFEWYVLRVGDCVVAAQMCIRCGAALMLAKIAFNEAYADCRPGHLLTGDVVRDAFARQDIVEINHLSNADWEGSWRMSYDEYVDLHLIRRRAIPILLLLPPTAARFAYQNYIRPQIPPRLKHIYRNYRRRGERKPLRSAVSRLLRSGDGGAE